MDTRTHYVEEPRLKTLRCFEGGPVDRGKIPTLVRGSSRGKLSGFPLDYQALRGFFWNLQVRRKPARDGEFPLERCPSGLRGWSHKPVDFARGSRGSNPLRQSSRSLTDPAEWIHPRSAGLREAATTAARTASIAELIGGTPNTVMWRVVPSSAW